MKQDTTQAPDDADGNSPARLVFLTIAVIALGLAVQGNAGNLSSMALLELTLALAAGWGAVWVGAETRVSKPWTMVGLCVVIQFALMAMDPLTGELSSGACKVYAMAVAVAAGLAGALWAASAAVRPKLFWLLVGVVVFLGCWLLRELPWPRIDVLLIQHHSWQALFQGLNPYAIHLPDPYPPDLSARFYGPGVSVDGELQFGHTYMPLTLILALPGYLVGDVRYASLAAMVLSATLMAWARPSRNSYLAAALLLSTPVFPLMLYASWTESYVLLLVAATWFCQCRAPRLVPYIVGLMLVSKQHMVIGVPVILMFLPRPWSLRTLWHFSWRAGVAGAVVTLPLVLWDPGAFFHSAVWLHFQQPFRLDALSYLAWADPQNPAQWMWLPFAAAGIAWLLILAASRRRSVPFSLALALTMATFFALNKQAFANYYYLVIGAFCVAAASGGGESPLVDEAQGESTAA